MVDVSAFQNQVVADMVARLRTVQGSGEFPPLTRTVTAGEGLEGGGTLEEDRELRLSDEYRALLDAIAAKGVDNLAVRGDLASFITSAALKPRVYYREFTVGEAPFAAVTAPPIRMDRPATLTQVSVAVGSPAATPTVVTVAGVKVTVQASGEYATSAVAVKFASGQPISVRVNATSAAKIVVSLRFEEE